MALLKKLMRPPPKISPAEWATTYRRMSAKESAFVGRFSFYLNPYFEWFLTEMMRRDVTRGVCRKSAQVGWTQAVILNLLGWLIQIRKGTAIVMFPKEGAAQAFNLEKFEPMVEGTPELAEIIPTKGRSKDVKQLFKNFLGGFLKFVGSNSISDVKSTSARYLVVEEPDDCNLNLRGQGDAIALLEERGKTFRDAKLLIGGTPSIKEVSSIDREFEQSKPVISAVIQQFKMLDKYSGAELDAAVINAMMAAFIETEMSSEDLFELMGGTAEGMDKEIRKRNRGRPRLKPGAIIPLYPGEKMSPFMPARPAAQFEAFTVAVMRHIAASMGLPYELLLKDFSKTNYSSARAALLEAWRTFRGRREKLADYWAQPCYELWLEEAVNAGLIDAPGFYEHRAAYCRSKWIGPGRGWVDPVKEAQAAQIRMNAGISTLEAECAEQGLDWEEVLEQRARELTRLRELGIDPASLAAVAPVTFVENQNVKGADDGQGSGSTA